jgi:hypothetical protein
MERHEIRATGYEGDMAGWCVGKSRYALDCAARIIDHLRSSQSLPKETTEIVLGELYSLVHDQSKLLAFATGRLREWSIEDARLVHTLGFAGYEQVAKKYGVIPETTPERYARQAAELRERVESLLMGGPSPNRTDLHVLLRAYRDNPQPAVASLGHRLEELLEPVTQGKLDWEQFVLLARAELANLPQWGAATTRRPPDSI